MKKILYIMALCSVFLASASVAKADDDDSDAFGARLSAEADWRIKKGVHAHVSEELRFLGGSQVFDRSYTEVGFSYRFCDYVKAAVSYTAIAVHETVAPIDAPDQLEHSIEWRHRMSGDLTFQYDMGQWRFSLRERIQGTHKTGDINNYQQPQTGWALRSRLKVAYKFRTVALEPYAYFEPRLMLNGAKWGDEAGSDDYKEAEFLGHKDVYVNRYRGAAGLEWTLNSRNSIDFYMLYDHLYDKLIDARKEGSNKGIQLKEPVKGIASDRISIGIAYKYSF